jgi:hypothetical protein
MKKFIIILLFILGIAAYVSAAPDLAQKLSGRILLQVQSHGEAWYVNPANLKRYYLGRPDDAFAIMQKLGLGARHEIITGYNIYPANLLGKILIDVDDLGKAYYINPADKRSYYLGRPADAFNVMRNFGLGITDDNLNKITIGYISNGADNNNGNDGNNNTADDNILSSAASAIRSGDKQSTLPYFTPEMYPMVEYVLNFLDSDGKLALANVLSAAELSNSDDNEKIYSTEIYFSLGGYNVPVKFYVKKQVDGKWLIANL